MASAAPALFGVIITPSFKKRTHGHLLLKVRAHSSKEEGGRDSSNMVESNLRVLRERIEHVEMKERLERCCRREHGWNYAPGYNYKLRKEAQLSEFLGLVRLATGTVALTLLTATLALCLISLLLHFIS